MVNDGGLIRTNVPMMLYLTFKSINPKTRIGISNPKEKIERATISKIGNNMTDILDEIYSNYTIIIDKGGNNEDYVHPIFRAHLLGLNSTLNCFIECPKYEWDTGTEIETGDLIQNTTKNYNNMVTEKECTKAKQSTIKYLCWRRVYLSHRKSIFVPKIMLIN